MCGPDSLTFTGGRATAPAAARPPPRRACPPAGPAPSREAHRRHPCGRSNVASPRLPPPCTSGYLLVPAPVLPLRRGVRGCLLIVTAVRRAPADPEVTHGNHTAGPGRAAARRRRGPEIRPG